MKKHIRYIIKITGTDSYHAGYTQDQKAWFTREPLGEEGKEPRALLFESTTQAATWAALNGWTCKTAAIEIISFYEDEEGNYVE
jgi:hypothetical protein